MRLPGPVNACGYVPRTGLKVYDLGLYHTVYRNDLIEHLAVDRVVHGNEGHFFTANGSRDAKAGYVDVVAPEDGAHLAYDAGPVIDPELKEGPLGYYVQMEPVEEHDPSLLVGKNGPPNRLSLPGPF